jgi:hypothetical protein
METRLWSNRRGTESSLVTARGIGDVFLFFGWFRQAERIQGRWRFVPNAPDLHVIFGWLEVGDVLSLVADRNDTLRRYPGLADHPHLADPAGYSDERNTLYVASEASSFVPRHVGGGAFAQFADGLCLTAPKAPRSVWNLPSWFLPREGRPPLTYHTDAKRWTAQGASCELKSVAKGQEFVLRMRDYPESLEWIHGIVKCGVKP